MAKKVVDVRTLPTEIDVSYGPFVVDVLELGYIGPPGPPGADGEPGTPGASAEAVTKTCQVALADSRVVVFLPNGEMNYANADELDDRRLSLGLTKAAGGTGDDVEVLTQGEWTQGAWSWTPGEAVYLALDGNMTQTVPTAPTYAFVRVVGVAVDSDVIYFKPEPPVILA